MAHPQFRSASRFPPGLERRRTAAHWGVRASRVAAEVVPMSRRRRSAAETNGGKARKQGRGERETPSIVPNGPSAGPPETDWFHRFASATARLCGRPVAFSIAAAVVLAWAVSGPLFGFSDTWQLVINTGTTIVTFLMVFLIQHTQNRDALAVQLKLADLIIAVRGAHNDLANAEEMSDAELEALHEAYRRRATETLDTLNRRRDRP
jgi:low affinity Fe/Cu permease